MKKLFKNILLLAVIAAFLVTPASAGINDRFTDLVNLISNYISFEGATKDQYETKLVPAEPTADRTITLPDATTTLIGTNTTDTLTNKTITTPTITTPTMTYGYTSYAYTSGSGATYAVSATGTVPHVYRITGGSGTTTFVMTYGGTAASNAGKLFYIINSSSNTVTFKSSGATGINVATLKIMTVVGNGTDFERITADQ